jgi:hypothetical protein
MIKVLLYAIPAVIVGWILLKTIHMLNHAVEMITRAMP